MVGDREIQSLQGCTRAIQGRFSSIAAVAMVERLTFGCADHHEIKPSRVSPRDGNRRTVRTHEWSATRNYPETGLWEIDGSFPRSRLLAQNNFRLARHPDRIRTSEFVIASSHFLRGGSTQAGYPLTPAFPVGVGSRSDPVILRTISPTSSSVKTLMECFAACIIACTASAVPGSP
jgi:hypothetical protein